MYKLSGDTMSNQVSKDTNNIPIVSIFVIFGESEKIKSNTSIKFLIFL